MNKKILFLLTFLSFSVISYAQLFTQIKLHTPHYYPGEIYFINGHSESFDEVELPMTWKNSIKVKKNSDDKKHTEINLTNSISPRIIIYLPTYLFFDSLEKMLMLEKIGCKRKGWQGMR